VNMQLSGLDSGQQYRIKFDYWTSYVDTATKLTMLCRFKLTTSCRCKLTTPPVCFFERSFS
jgi:hypothetical protein